MVPFSLPACWGQGMGTFLSFPTSPSSSPCPLTSWPSVTVLLPMVSHSVVVACLHCSSKLLLPDFLKKKNFKPLLKQHVWEGGQGQDTSHAYQTCSLLSPPLPTPLCARVLPPPCSTHHPGSPCSLLLWSCSPLKIGSWQQTLFLFVHVFVSTGRATDIVGRLMEIYSGVGKH